MYAKCPYYFDLYTQRVLVTALYAIAPSPASLCSYSSPLGHSNTQLTAKTAQLTACHRLPRLPHRATPAASCPLGSRLYTKQSTLSIYCRQNPALLSLECLDADSGRRILAIWHGTSAYPGLCFYPRNLVLNIEYFNIHG